MIKPMLAHVFEKRKKHIIYACATQPKLDGIRCIYDGKGKLWTRTGKPIISAPHILHALKGEKRVLDGELYNHDYRDNFEELVSMIRQQTKVHPNHKEIQFHVYDLPSPEPFINRSATLDYIRFKYKDDNCIRIVETYIVHSEEELMDYNQDCLARGYEGSMVRNLGTPYEYKRSNSLQKIKTFEDAEFRIIGGHEGMGKLKGHLGAFECITKEGNIFKAKLTGSQDALKGYLEHLDKYIGKQLTVKFQGYSNKNNVPRFPVGLRIHIGD